MNFASRRMRVLFVSAIVLWSVRGYPESSRAAWLRYAPLPAGAATQFSALHNSVVELGKSHILDNARHELILGIQGMLSRDLRPLDALSTESSIVLGTSDSLRGAFPDLKIPDLSADAYSLAAQDVRGAQSIIIAGGSDRGVLYGVFALLNRIALGQSLAHLDEVQQPYASIRWIDQWDNLDGSIERGYGGPSIFFANGNVRGDLTRAGQYARLLASIGINGCTINNVNAAPGILEDSFIAQVSRIADVFRPWGVQLSLSVDLSSPKVIGGLDTFDPLDPRVADWWRKKADEIYRRIPDFGGFVVKADSEGRLGPSTYGRTPADAANVIARALKPHGGVVFYRAFVYNHHLDWRNLKNDRARAAYDNFHPLDGQFDDNVIIQIKHGPIDFQAREPVSPLFSGLEKTNEAIELQITQEYTGQARHMVFLAPMWKEVLDFDMHAARDNALNTPVKNIISGKVFHRPLGGYIGIANVGLDANWLAHPLSMANLYAFGRLAWNPDTTPEQIATEWTQLTFGDDPTVVQTISGLQLASWHTYENYTGPLGTQTLTDITGSHFGPNIESSEENGWGQWHRADEKGIGMDRTVATGTGYVGQYRPPVAKIYESLATTPDELVLL